LTLVGISIIIIIKVKIPYEKTVMGIVGPKSLTERNRRWLRAVLRKGGTEVAPRSSGLEIIVEACGLGR